MSPLYPHPHPFQLGSIWGRTNYDAWLLWIFMFNWLDGLRWTDSKVQPLSLIWKSVLFCVCFFPWMVLSYTRIYTRFLFFLLFIDQWCSSPSMGSLLNFPLVKNTHTLFADDTQCRWLFSLFIVVFQRTAGSSSDGTEDSDFSTDLEHTEAPEGSRTRSSSRLTRASLRLSQNSQGKCLKSFLRSNAR